MMIHWTYFALGAFCGIVATLFFVVYARSYRAVPASAGSAPENAMTDHKPSMVSCVLVPKPIYYWGVSMVFAATLVLLGGCGLAVYFANVIVHAPDTPLQAPTPAKEKP